MAKISPPTKEAPAKTPKPTDQIPPEKITVLQLTNCPETLKSDYKAYTAKSPYKTMTELFEAMFKEYQENHPV